MFTSVVVLAVIVGCVFGILVFDLRDRKSFREEVIELTAEQEASAETLMKLHNATVAKNLEITERLQSLEVMLKGRDQQQNLVRKF